MAWGPYDLGNHRTDDVRYGAGDLAGGVVVGGVWVDVMPELQLILWAIAAHGGAASQREICKHLQAQYSHLKTCEALFAYKRDGLLRLDGNSRYVPVDTTEVRLLRHDEELQELRDRVSRLEGDLQALNRETRHVRMGRP